MSIESYEELMERLELYESIQIGLSQIEHGEIITEEKMMKNLKRHIGEK